MTRELIYTPCLRCQCPMTIFLTDKRHRFLCVRCHENMAANSPRHKGSCCCGAINECQPCYQRELSYRYRQRHKDRRREAWQDYYYANWEKMRAKRNAWEKEYRAKKRQQKKQSEQPPTKS